MADTLTGLDDARRGRLPRSRRSLSSGGAIYHFNARNGSRSKGHSARAAAAYIQRAAEYSRDQAEELVYTESGHMPGWAAAEPTAYWDAADLYERKNGQLFKRVEVALPLALTAAERQELAVGFAHHLTDAERLPYTLAIHAGEGSNPHCHLLISERANDGLERSPEQWFKRFNAEEPDQGGARKSRALQPKAWLLAAREAWAAQTNQALERGGHEVRIDHRSLAAQGVERLPSVHLGPTVAAMEARGVESERGAEDRRRAGVNAERAGLSAELAAVEAELAELAGQQEEVEHERTKPESEREPGRAGVERAGGEVGREGGDVGGHARGVGAGGLRGADHRPGAERDEGRGAGGGGGEAMERVGAEAAGGGERAGARDTEPAPEPYGRARPHRESDRGISGPEPAAGTPARAVAVGLEPGPVEGGAGERGRERGYDAGRDDAVSGVRAAGPGAGQAGEAEHDLAGAMGGDDRGGAGADTETRVARGRAAEVAPAQAGGREAAVEREAREAVRAQMAATREAREAVRAQMAATREARQQEQEQERARERQRDRDRERERDTGPELEP